MSKSSGYIIDKEDYNKIMILMKEIDDKLLSVLFILKKISGNK